MQLVLRSCYLVGNDATIPADPVVYLEDRVELFVQSLHLDVADLFEASEPVNYSENRRSRTTPTKDSSLAGEVDKALLLEVLEQELDDETAKAEALANVLQIRAMMASN